MNDSNIIEEKNDDMINDNIVEQDVKSEPEQVKVEVEELIAIKDEEIKQLKDSLLRTIAENENFQKRMQREKEDLTKYTLTKFARDLLPVLDNFARAIEATNNLIESVDVGIIDGIKITEKELLSVLAKNSIIPIEAKQGDLFDPIQHQAMLEVESADVESGKIVSILQVGYMIGERLLRPTMVSVAKNNDALEN